MVIQNDNCIEQNGKVLEQKDKLIKQNGRTKWWAVKSVFINLYIIIILTLVTYKILL
jgi:hypothetical protein